MLRHLLNEAASALMTRCRQPSKLRAWGVAVARRRGPKRPGGCGAQARGDHAPYVGLREPVRDWSWEGAVGHRVAAVASSFDLHDHNLDGGTDQSDTTPANAAQSERVE